MRGLALAIVVGLSTLAGGCSKCDVPTFGGWRGPAFFGPMACEQRVPGR
jgi:hypothetical protein